MKVWHFVAAIATIIGFLIGIQFALGYYQTQLLQAELAPIKEQVNNHLPTAIRELGDRIDRVEARIDRIDARIDRIDARIDRIDAKLDTLIIHLTPKPTSIDQS